jgi:hypothetical protein
MSIGSGKRQLTEDVGGTEEHKDAQAQRERDAEADFASDHDDDNAGVGKGDDEEGEPAKQDTENCAKHPFLDEVTVKFRAKGKNPCVPCFYLLGRMLDACWHRRPAGGGSGGVVVCLFLYINIE